MRQRKNIIKNLRKNQQQHTFEIGAIEIAENTNGYEFIYGVHSSECTPCTQFIRTHINACALNINGRIKGKLNQCCVHIDIHFIYIEINNSN